MNLILTPEKQEEHWRNLETALWYLNKKDWEMDWRIECAIAWIKRADESWRKIVIEQKNKEFGIK